MSEDGLVSLSKRPTPAAVAAWMWATIRAEADLDFRRTADRVRERFGEAFVEKTTLGRATIRKDVRDLFNGLHGGRIVRGGGRWYLRGRQGFGGRVTPPVQEGEKS